MQKRELVSVIIPIYCSETYLSKCIESIQKQTYTNLEIVLVDDGSTDGSLEICREYANNDSRIMLIHQNNQGVSAARNKGIEVSTGEYIMFVDSDDFLVSNAIGILLHDIRKYNADISSASKETINKNGQIISKYNDKKAYIYEGSEALEQALSGNPQTNSVCAKLFKKHVLEQVRFVEGRHTNEDAFFLFECFMKKIKFIHRNISIYKYIIRDDSASRNSAFERYLDMLYFCDLKKSIIEKFYPELLQQAYQMEGQTTLRFLLVTSKFKDKKAKAYETICIHRLKILKPFLIPKNTKEKVLIKLVLNNCFFIYKIFRKIFRSKNNVGNSVRR